MRKTLLLCLTFLLVSDVAVQAGPKGYLFIIGGGEREASLMKRYVELANRFGTGKIVIFTMASGVPQEVGPELVAEFQSLGSKHVVAHQLSRDEAVKPDSEAILEGVGGIFFSGGVQSRLTDALLETPIHRKMLDLYEKGCIIGGTSAGAAVMSEIMITGDEKRTQKEDELWEAIWSDNIVWARGFGFVKNAIFDQHFLVRRRQNRLISLVIENPGLVGVGIDESTAVLVRPDGRWEILGENQVIVYDARHARTFTSVTNRLGVHGMIMHVLLAGDVFDIARGKVEAR